jgi:hypothetical protein
LAVLILAGAVSARADSTPPIAGQVFGIELCPQSFCGEATFAAFFIGQVGIQRRALGAIVVSVHHQDLPDPGDTSAITDGEFVLRANLRQFHGTVVGTLLNNGNNTFTVDATLTLDQGGTGDMNFLGILDHNVLPPTIIGMISQ